MKNSAELKTQRQLQKWCTIGTFIILGGFDIYLWIDQLRNPSALAEAGLPVAAILGFATILGLVVSFIVFRTPHDGETEL